MKKLFVCLCVLWAGVAQATSLENMKIPAVLETPIVMAVDSDVQVVKYKVLENMIDPKTNKVFVPAGSVLIGTIESVDTETGTSSIKFLGIYKGAKKLEVQGLNSMAVSSADGSKGLKGQLYDTKGKYLLGSFVSTYSSSSLSNISQESAEKINSRLNSVALSGGAKVAAEIQSLGDLSQYSKVYYVPQGVPAILSNK